MGATRTSKSLDPFPDGWYLVGPSEDIRAGKLIEKTWMGEEIVVWRGGDGVVRRVRFGEAMTVNILSSHRVVPPYGVDGGAPGAVGVNRVIRADGSDELLAGADSCQVGAGDIVEIATPGGGGYGRPLDG